MYGALLEALWGTVRGMYAALLTSNFYGVSAAFQTLRLSRLS